MGYRWRHGRIKTFWPDDTDDRIHLESDHNLCLETIIEKVKTKWGDDISLSDINITSSFIHTDCLYYDGYDPSDYTNFIIIDYNKG